MYIKEHTHNVIKHYVFIMWAITMGCTNLWHANLDLDWTPDIPWLYSQGPQLLTYIMDSRFKFLDFGKDLSWEDASTKVWLEAHLDLQEHVKANLIEAKPTKILLVFYM